MDRGQSTVKRRALLWGQLWSRVKWNDAKNDGLIRFKPWQAKHFLFSALFLLIFLQFPRFVADFQVWVSHRLGFFFRIPTLSRCVYMFQLNQTCNQGGIFSTAGGGAFRPRSGRSLLCCPWLIKTLELLGFPMSWFRISKKISLKPCVFRKSKVLPVCNYIVRQ